jgi:beta-N-acetylhexosaminidase
MLVIGVAGTELTAQERDWLQHDACGGVILFSRNFASKAQVAELSQAIREAARQPQLVCVDQEGGRVQRFREGFAALPRLEVFDDLYRRDPEGATKLAIEHAWLMASEVRATGVDLSFAPVVDLGRGNRAIGDRAFSADPKIVAEFTRAYIEGMHAADMAATGMARCSRTRISTTPWTRVRWTSSVRSTWSRSWPASTPARTP